MAVLESALGEVWDDLPDLIGVDWPVVEMQLLTLLRKLEAEGDASAAAAEIERLFAPYPEAWRRVAVAIEAAQAEDAADMGFETVAAVRKARHVEVPVFYGTVRAPTGSDKPSAFYGTERGPLGLGRVTVSIPDDHRMGELEAPRKWRLEFRQNPDKHVVLLTVTPLDHDEFVAEAGAAAAETDEPEALIFIHGYSNSFENAARRAAQVAYDLDFKGVPMMFSWPSAEKTAGYTIDENNARWSQQYFAEFLDLVRTKLGLSRVHVIAHSMGNRLLAETLPTYATEGADLNQVMFAAPDIDADTFRQLAAAFHGKASRFTLYASSNDVALKASKLVHGESRAGDAGDDVVLVDGIDTVDASLVETALLGHSYFGDERTLLSDLFVLVRSGAGPDDRPSLEARERNGVGYWGFRP